MLAWRLSTKGTEPYWWAYQPSEPAVSAVAPARAVLEAQKG